MVDITLVRSNSVVYDPRVDKISSSLSKKYSLMVLGWNREGLTKQIINEYTVALKLFNVKTSFWRPSLLRITLRLFAYFSIFWIWIFINLCIYRPKIIHACDLDTVIPCYLYKIFFKRKLVFDVFDRYGTTFIPMKFKILYYFVNSLEDNIAKGSDVLINVSDELLETYKKRPRNCVTIMNCSMDHMKDGSRVEGNELKLLFTGHIRPGRGLEILPDIVKSLNDTQLIITGRTEDEKLLNEIEGIPNVKYRGFLDHNEVLDLEATSDVMIALYDLNLKTQNKFVMGNKFFEAMMCGIPVISNVAQELIKEIDCGIVVEYDNVDQIRDAIIMLRDNPELRKRLGNNGRKAFLEKYNWNKMEQKLYEIYDDLLNK